MKRSWLLCGLLIYALFGLVIFPFFIGIPVVTIFGSDAVDYSKAAINLLLHSFYSIDGITPFIDREPGMSFFLVVVYAVFGIESVIGFSLVQGIMIFLVAWFFCNEASRLTGWRAAGICFLLLLVSGSVFHAIFSAYRECLALSLLLLFSGFFLSYERKRAWWKAIIMGIIFGFLILTYYPFIFFPPVLFFVWWIRRKPLRDAAIVILLCYLTVGAWALRNHAQTGKFTVIDDRRTVIMWYVRGVQAEHVRGTEPFLCLYAEYISRDWTGTSPQCSFNGLMHQRWPNGVESGVDYSALEKESKAKIMANLPSYLWFSAVDTIELHLPYLGGGWSHAYNVYASLSMLVLYIGFAFGLPALVRREYVLWFLLIGYNTAVFILTDATPRYLMPVIFCYALFAGIGYDWLITKITRKS
ncbi:MAG: glycosyltransferase family 39 protein [Candidatus Peribacteraceae bacterium]|nr:glycosyltransferase family 39 protein [Candidatus Peribacteraceae bacterium]MBP9850383.1 glycosyltransferase family 39 protein [Candidatus Peribacteraceae bacterium]